MQFVHAVSNWRSAHKEEVDVHRHTCGSAERMYADHPERSGGAPERPRYIDERGAALFESLVSRLPDEWRRAWHIRHGFRTKGDETDEWINEHYNQARAQLSVWWSLSRR